MLDPHGLQAASERARSLFAASVQAEPYPMAQLRLPGGAHPWPVRVHPIADEMTEEVPEVAKPQSPADLCRSDDLFGGELYEIAKQEGRFHLRSERLRRQR